MRFHTDKLTDADVHAALGRTGLAGEGVWLDTCDPHGSRKRARAFEVHLSADPGRDRFGDPRRYANTGYAGADPATKAATYAEWGVLIAALMDADPDAIFGPYQGRDDFHRQTDNRFRTAEVSA